MRRRLKVKFWLIIGFLAAVALLLSRGNLSKDYHDLREALGIKAENFAYELTPPRMPVSGISGKEAAIRADFGPVFEKFTDQDWQDLWYIIYGVYPEYDSDNERLPPRRTQLTIPEMQEELKARFPYSFAYFNQEHWWYFWKALKIKDKP